MPDIVATIEEQLLAIVIHRLRINQAGQDGSCWYEAAIGKCEDALEDLQIKRSEDRKQRPVTAKPDHDA